MGERLMEANGAGADIDSVFKREQRSSDYSPTLKQLIRCDPHSLIARQQLRRYIYHQLLTLRASSLVYTYARLELTSYHLWD